MLRKIQSNSIVRPSSQSKELSRILTAAVINCNFRKALLENPILAVNCGYGNEHFQLHTDEKERLTTISATSLAEFAQQLAQI